MSRDSAGAVRYPDISMDSVVKEGEADDRFDTARVTAAVDALAEKHAGREDQFRAALAQLLKAGVGPRLAPEPEEREWTHFIR